MSTSERLLRLHVSGSIPTFEFAIFSVFISSKEQLKVFDVCGSGLGLEFVEDRIAGFARWRMLLEYLESCVEEELRGVFSQVGVLVSGRICMCDVVFISRFCA
ncbi:hypothetical protein KC19_N002000 [Ceratodon purpureus]|nr:hypothetical protein KC19_N002000 [Ceratodon purpureus]